MATQYVCEMKGRVAALRRAATASPATLLNGIEYLEVGPDHSTLEVHFVHDLSIAPATALQAGNVEIRGGERVRDPKVRNVTATGEVLIVEVETPGDFSLYRLRLVGSQDRDAPPEGIDPALSEIEFSFKVDCPSAFDCRQERECPPEVVPSPQIDYLAKDYNSFRRLMLDRLSALLPGWRERNPADLTVALVELLAFRADELSYYQDAVAAEAYLGTARRRTSVRRHARLLDYPFHEGCNARAWVTFEVDAAGDGRTLSGCEPETGLGGTLLLTKVAGHEAARIDEQGAQAALDGARAHAFELLHDITLYEAHNSIGFFTWSEEECCLPKAATRAFLLDEPGNRLRLMEGDVLIFEEVRSRDTGEPADADRTHRHAVRLTRVEPSAGLTFNGRSIPPERRDPVTGLCYVEVHWSVEDALPFPLCLSRRMNGALITDIAVARANVALADHGLTLSRPEPLPSPVDVKRYRPLLPKTLVAPVTIQGRVQAKDSDSLLLVDRNAPASEALSWELATVRPAMELRNLRDSSRWAPRSDLIESNSFANDFVVEMEDDGRSYLRFGDGINGRKPIEGDELVARYRIGNGTAGNVGPDSIRHIVVPFNGITAVRNPLAAAGGVNPHPMDQVKLYAPQAFRKQERAVTLEDYARTAERHPQVQRALATRRWTGAWHTIFLTVDRRGGAEIDAEFEADVRAFLERFRLAGHDLEIDAPRFVPLDLSFDVCAKPGYFTADVQQRLLREFSRDTFPDGRKGFFHPDQFTFGTPVYLSAVIARAMQIPGVDFVAPKRFQRWRRTPAGEIDAGLISFARLEIARLDNDANAPENGRIELNVHVPTGARVS